MKSEAKYKGNPARGILVIVAFAALTILAGNETYSNEQTITYFFENSAKRLQSTKTSISKLPTFSITSKPNVTPQLNLAWKPMPSSTPTISPTALFNSNITPSETPLTLKMLVSATLTGNNVKFNVSLVDQDSNPIQGASGYIQMGQTKYQLPPTDNKGDTNLSTTISSGESVIIYESAYGLGVLDTLNVSN